MTDPTPPASPDEAARAAFEAWALSYFGDHFVDLDEDDQRMWRCARSAWQAGRAHDTAASPQEGAQAGWRLAPVEPTEAMLDAGMQAPMPMALYDSRRAEGHAYLAARWKYMIAAAPAPQEGG